MQIARRNGPSLESERQCLDKSDPDPGLSKEQESEPSVPCPRNAKHVVRFRLESESVTEQPKQGPRTKVDDDTDITDNNNDDRNQPKTQRRRESQPTKKDKHKRPRNKTTTTATTTTATTTATKERSTDRPPQTNDGPTQTTSSHRRRRHRTHSPIDRPTRRTGIRAGEEGRRRRHQSSTTELERGTSLTMTTGTATTTNQPTYRQSRPVLTRQVSEASFFSDKERKHLENLQNISEEMKHFILELTSPLQPLDARHGASLRHPPASNSENRPAAITLADDKKRASKKTKIRGTGAPRRAKKDSTIHRRSSAAAETNEDPPVPTVQPTRKSYTLSTRRRDTKSDHPLPAAGALQHLDKSTATLPHKVLQDELVHLMMDPSSSSRNEPDTIQQRIAESLRSSANWYDRNETKVKKTKKKKTARNLIDTFNANLHSDDNTNQAPLEDLWCPMHNLLLYGSEGNTEATAPPSSIEEDDYEAVAIVTVLAAENVTFTDEGGTEHGVLKAHDATLRHVKSRANQLANAARLRGATEMVRDPTMPTHATFSGNSTISSYSSVKQTRSSSILETDGIGDILHSKLASAALNDLPLKSKIKARLESGEHSSASEGSAPERSRSVSAQSSIILEPDYDELTLESDCRLLAAPIPVMLTDSQEASCCSSTVVPSRQLFHSLDSIEDKLNEILENEMNRRVFLEAKKISTCPKLS